MTKRKASVALETGNESNQSASTQDNNSNSNSIVGPNNSNHPNQNGSSGSGSDSCRQQQVGEISDGVQHKIKKERADNWSSAEIQVLHRGIESRRDVFYGPPSQASKKNRELAWDAITKEVNAVSTTPRSLSQVMKKFKNEKCRAKRKFVESDKDENNSMTNNNGITSNSNNSGTTSRSNGQNLSNQNHTNNNQQLQQQQQPQQLQQQQSHQMTNSDSTITSQPSINVVKLAPQNVAKTMIDLPGHVQQIQMPNDDMVLIVPPEMDGLLSGMNIVSDALSNQQHNQHGPHTIQTINGPGIVNGTMGNGMMARTIPAGSMCSLVYSTGGEIGVPDQHVTGGSNQLATASHIGANAQNLMHHRGSIEQGHQHPHHHQSHPHQQQHHHQQQQPQQQPHQQQHQQSQQQGHPQHQPQHQHQHPQQMHHHPNHLQQNHLAPAATLAGTNTVAAESQLKNLLFNLLLKEGQNSMPGTVNTNQDYNKHRNDMLAIIANSLNKIEGHLNKLTKVATSYFTQTAVGPTIASIGAPNAASLPTGSMSATASDSNNNPVTMTGSTSTLNPRVADT